MDLVVAVDVSKRGALAGPEESDIELSVAVVIRRIGRKNGQSSIDREGFQLDAEADAVLVREGGGDLGPALADHAVAFVFLDGEDVDDVDRCLFPGPL